MLIKASENKIRLALLIGLSSFGLGIADRAFAQNSDGQVRGIIKAVDEAVLTADLRVPVRAVNFQPGQAFERGATLIEFDCTAQFAEADAAKAAFASSKARYDNQQEMLALEAAGQFDVQLAKAEMDEAAARSRVISSRNKGCKLIAPYDGRIAQLSINAHELPAVDQPLMKIVGSQTLELRLIVPSRWLSWLTSDATFNFIVDETGERHTATVSRLGAEVDAVSGTIAVIATFTTLPSTILPGMSGTAEFNLPQG